MSQSNEDKRLFLLDAYALIFRAYYAFIKNPRVNSRGQNTSAIFGFANTFLEIIRKEKPTHLAVVFDPPGGPTQRLETYSDYKANRDATPEDIKLSVPYIKRLIHAFRIPVLELPGYEADDVIGTLAKKAEREGYTTYMMTPDKDFAQLVSPNIFMYKPSRNGENAEIWGVDEVKKNFEIERVEQVIDFLGMMGDAVDNIPGIPGVGEKTAKKLIAEFGSIENLYDNLDKVQGKIGEKIAAAKDLAYMSKNLATIITDAPIEFDEGALVMEEPNLEELTGLFEELEFRTLMSRLNVAVVGSNEAAQAPSSAPKTAKQEAQMDLFGSPEGEDMPRQMTAGQNIENTPHEYHLVKTEDEIAALISVLESAESFCFDTETTHIDALYAELVGFAFSMKKGEGYYVPIPADKDECRRLVLRFQSVLEDRKKLKIGQNLKYDLTVLKHYGIALSDPLFDTMLAHYLLQPDMRHNMDLLSETYLNYSPVSIDTLIGKKGKNQITMREVDVALVKEYAAEDADITLQLQEIFAPKLTENQMDSLFQSIEIPLLPVLADMEWEGIRLDTAFLKEYEKELAQELKRVEMEIYEMAGQKFNIASPKQLGEILFEKMGIASQSKKTKTGQYSTAEDTLQKIAHEHPMIEKILEYRGTSKLISTYVSALPLMVNPNTGRVHTSFNQAVAATGRLSSNNPNLQNIPIRTPQGEKVRKAFIPRSEEFVLLSADYSQIELRLIASMSGDENMIDAFRQGQDIHAATAARVNGVAIDQVTREMRSRAKMVNFGIIYGISAFGLAERLNISRTEAKELIDTYFEKYPGIKTYMDSQIQFARDNGYVATMFGRRRYLADINSRNQTVRGFAERNAINAPIQGSAADVIKKAMISLHHEMKSRGLKSKMLLQVHDELVFDAHHSEMAELKGLVKANMENALKLEVPLVVDMGTGQNWLEAH
jgi:DNA polymerase-1